MAVITIAAMAGAGRARARARAGARTAANAAGRGDLDPRLREASSQSLRSRTSRANRLVSACRRVVGGRRLPEPKAGVFGR